MSICYNCGANDFQETMVNETFDAAGKLVLVEKIPAKVCCRCGEVIFSGEIAEKVRLMIQGKTQLIKSIQVDLFAYNG